MFQPTPYSSPAALNLAKLQTLASSLSGAAGIILALPSLVLLAILLFTPLNEWEPVFIVLFITMLVGGLAPFVGLFACLRAVRRGENGWQRRHTVMCLATIIVPFLTSLISIRVQTGSFLPFF